MHHQLLEPAQELPHGGAEVLQRGRARQADHQSAVVLRAQWVRTFLLPEHEEEQLRGVPLQGGGRAVRRRHQH